MAEGVGATVSETVRQTVEAVAAIAPLDGVQLRPLADKLELDKSNVSRRLRHAADGGYVRNLEDKRGKPGRWVIGDPLPEAADLLPEPGATPQHLQPPDQDRCGVAPVSDGERADADGTRPCAICSRPFYPQPTEPSGLRPMHPAPRRHLHPQGRNPGRNTAMTTTTHEIHTTDCGCFVVAEQWHHVLDGVTVEHNAVDLGVIAFASTVSLNAFAGPNSLGSYHVTRGAAIALARSLLRPYSSSDRLWRPRPLGSATQPLQARPTHRANTAGIIIIPRPIAASASSGWRTRKTRDPARCRHRSRSCSNRRLR